MRYGRIRGMGRMCSIERMCRKDVWHRKDGQEGYEVYEGCTGRD